MQKLQCPIYNDYTLETFLIKNVEDLHTAGFLTRKVFNSDDFCFAYYKQEMRKSLLQRNRKVVNRIAIFALEITLPNPFP